MKLLPILILSLATSLHLHTANSTDPAANSCDANSQQGTGSQISKNIDNLLPKLVSGTLQNGFIATSFGQGKDTVFGLAQCRADVPYTECSTCIREAATEIRKLCPKEAHATIWYDYCFLKYRTDNFFDQVDTSGVLLINTQNVTETDPRAFRKKLSAVMDRIQGEAVKPASKGLGKGKLDISAFSRLYALVQCTRDLSALNCAQCVAVAVSNFPSVCGDRRGCRFLYESCYVRYELYPFFFPVEAGETLEQSLDKYVRIKPTRT